VRGGEVIETVLNELEAGQAHGVEGDVVGATGVAERDGGRTQIAKGFEPLGKHGGHGLIALGVDAADFTSTVVEVEVGGQLGVGGLQLHGGGVGKVIFHVVARAVQALLLFAPQRKADGAARPQAAGFKNAHRLHHHGAAGGVIGGPGGGVPGVEVGAEHHHLAFQLAVGARDFGHHVVALQVLGLEAGFGFHLHFHRNTGFRQADEAQLVFGRHFHFGQHRLGVDGVGGAVAGVEGAVNAPAGAEHGGGPFAEQHFRQPGAQGGLDFAGGQGRGIGQVGGRPGRGGVGHFLQLPVGVALEVGGGAGLGRRGHAHHHNFIAQLALVAVQVGLGGHFHHHNALAQGTGRAGCPGLGHANHGVVIRGREGHVRFLDVPTAAEVAPGLDGGVGQAVAGELPFGPLVGALQALGVGQARAAHVGQVKGRFHHLRAVQAFVADFGQGGRVGFFGGLGLARGGAGQAAGEGEKQDFSHGRRSGMVGWWDGGKGNGKIH